MKLSNFENIKTLGLIGFGKEGQSSLKFFQKKFPKIEISIFDENTKIKLSDKNIKTFLGKNSFKDLQNLDFYIKSPGISRHLFPEIQKKFEEGKNSSQIEIFLENIKGKIIGITGTKGKSTVSSAIFEIFKKNFGTENTKLLGNIGKPFLDEFEKNLEEKIYVLEISSYQAEDLKGKDLLDFGLLLNIFPDHISYHKTFKNYEKAKKNILKISKESFDFSGENQDFYLKNLKINLKGEHNLKNLQIGGFIAKKFGISEEKIRKVLGKFQSLKYRLEEFQKNEKTFVIDTLSTNPNSAISAIATYKTSLSAIILGGENRGFEFGDLIKNLEKLEDLKTIGILKTSSGKKLLELFKKNENFKNKEIIFGKMEEICKKIIENSPKKSTILFSPASPSFELYKNYIEAGEDFRKNILKI